MTNGDVNEDMLHAYVDQCLPSEQRARVEAYLARHPAEAQRLASYRQIDTALKSAFEATLREPVPPHLSAVTSGPERRFILRALSLGACTALGAVAGWTLRGLFPAADTSATANDQALARRALLAHSIYTAEQRRAVEVAASEEQSMMNWLSKRMNVGLRVPRLSEFGFEPLGGRLLPGEQGPACQLMYQNAEGKRLTVYLAREPSARPAAFHFTERDRIHLVFWSDGTLAIAVAGEVDRATLAKIAEQVSRSIRV